LGSYLVFITTSCSGFLKITLEFEKTFSPVFKTNQNKKTPDAGFFKKASIWWFHEMIDWQRQFYSWIFDQFLDHLKTMLIYQS